MRRDNLAVLSVAVLCLAVCARLVNATSDPAANACESVCWDENALADQCESENGCDVNVMSSSAYRTCARPCWAEVSACQLMCRARFERVLERCWPRCEEDTSENCVWNCFTNIVLSVKEKIRRRNNGTLVSPREDS
ncbi:uncharacterized protein LOC106013536 [Aplysia californica]|uniref:Uncharacterized protein LOC106013536 n=1 Tax=Aplysia californica TaxID=6500 RepID=A0ABM1ACA8_APLCA|nr:uncharacterized protein LOC106013536 [Aplysia californica]